MFFFIIGVLYYRKTTSSLSVLQNGVEETLETAVNRTVDISNQPLTSHHTAFVIPRPGLPEFT
jgi:hypothetical protein